MLYNANDLDCIGLLSFKKTRSGVMVECLFIGNFVSVFTSGSEMRGTGVV